jgi:hypothetical protein
MLQGELAVEEDGLGRLAPARRRQLLGAERAVERAQERLVVRRRRAQADASPDEGGTRRGRRPSRLGKGEGRGVEKRRGGQEKLG